MRYLLLMTIFVCVFFYMNGQTRNHTNEAEQNIRAMTNLVNGPGALGFDERYEGSKGTPYLFDQWRTARAKMYGLDTFSAEIKMNVDLMRQLMTILLRDGTTGYISPFNIRNIIIEEAGGSSSHWIVLSEHKVEGSNNEQPKFYEVLHQGDDYTLLKETKKLLIKATFQQPYSVSRNYDEFVTEYHYWLKEGDAPFNKVTLRKKVLEKALSEKETSVRQIAKTQNIDVREEAGIVRLLEFLETTER